DRQRRCMSALPDYSEALALALRDVSPIDRNDSVSLELAGCRVLAQTIQADRDLPPFDRAQMDGYALRASDLGPGKSFPVVGMIAAGTSAANVQVPHCACVAIATG